jgi:hypothetical protein
MYNAAWLESLRIQVEKAIRDQNVRGRAHFQMIDWLRLRRSSVQRAAVQLPRARRNERQKATISRAKRPAATAC